MLKVTRRMIGFTALLLLAGCGQGEEDSQSQADGEADRHISIQEVDGTAIRNADRHAGDWLSYGRTYSEQRYSPLKQITDKNVQDLGLAWYFDLDTNRGQEATPIVVDGVMYVSTAWSMVKALDAKTGELIWEYDPEVPRRWLINTCCGPVNRGVALWKGKIYLGALDGRLIALDAETGEVVWTVQTTDPEIRYSITGAPRVVNGKVIIGNGGAEFGVRGYVTAYDAETGERAWRFYTVPGDPSTPPDNPIHEMTAKTWTGEWWTMGGGGTAWDSFAYDPELNLLYIGTGNGSPWNQSIRSPGGGDNLFLSSIVAVNADTGEYVWHYQTTPGETWDYTATQHMILADIELDGKVRKVIMQAPKNGFFYVIDRETGEFISAEPYVDINWATGVDPETGRPMEVPEARYYATNETWVANPGPLGAHSWHPMSYSPDTGLVYLPAQVMFFPYIEDTSYQPSPKAFNTGVDFNKASLPTEPEALNEVLATVRGHLAAWDPVKQQEVWRVQYEGPWNGGILSTAGNLVFQGTAKANFAAYQADTGKELWSAPTQTGVIAAPVTYTVDGEQYIAVEAGWGGIFSLVPGAVGKKSGITRNISRILVFKLGGDASLPPFEDFRPPLDPPPLDADEETLAAGKNRYHRFCGSCHGDSVVAAGSVPDLRYSATIQDEVWFDVVLDGLLAENGMVSFDSELTREQAAAIRDYVIARAHETKKHEAETGEEMDP